MGAMGQQKDKPMSDFADASKHMATSTAQKVGEQAKKVGHDAETLMSNAADKAKDAASYIGDKAEAATGAVGSGMESLGQSIREHAPKGGVLGNAGGVVADKLESGGRYLEDHGLQHMGEEMTSMIRRNPIPAVLVGVGLGFILARMMRS